MGLDGGTKITRSDVLRGQSWRLTTADTSRSTRGGAVPTTELLQDNKIDKRLAKKIKWTTCAISEQPLLKPVVADYLGNLYNKNAVLTFLLNRSGVFASKNEEHAFKNLMQKSASRFEHLRRRHDVFEILTSEEEESFRCPVSDLDCLSTPFSALSSCGHLFSDRAIAQMTDTLCMICSKFFSSIEVIPINPEDHNVQESLKRRLKNQQKKHSGRSKKKQRV